MLCLNVNLKVWLGFCLVITICTIISDFLMKHKVLQPEKMRKPSFGPPLSVSPLKDQGRVEPCYNSGTDMSPSALPTLEVMDCDHCGEVFECGEDLEDHTVWCPRCEEQSCNTLNPSLTTCPGCSKPWEPLVEWKHVFVLFFYAPVWLLQKPSSIGKSVLVA